MFKIATAALALGVMVSGTANATILTVFDGIAAGSSTFDTTVAAAGGTVNTDVLSGMTSGYSIDRGDYTITANDGGYLGVTSYGTMSGQVLGIDPAGSGPGIGAFGSGVTFTFGTAVNSIGFEVGDWATCCFLPSNLYISFDDGAPILVGSASKASDGQFPSQSGGYLTHEIFVAAFDDSGTFTKVSFWGDGFGEYLVAGGQVKYALVDEGSLPPPVSPVPVPAAGLLLFGGMGALAGLRRLRNRG